MPKRNKSTLQDVFVSVVVVTTPETKKLKEEIEALSAILQKQYSNYEIILVDNLIEHKEFERITNLLDRVPCVRIVRLSRVYKKDICVFVGLETAIGDIVVIRSPHDPIKLVTKFVAQAEKADIVLGVSTKKIRRGLANHFGAKLFYWYNKSFLHILIPENSTYFMAFTRRAVNALTRTGRHARHIRYLARQIGYITRELPYTPEKGYFQEKKSLPELLISALELATNYSQHPLRFWSWLGFGASLLNLVYVGYVIMLRLLHKHVVEGWTTLSLQSAGMFFLLFAILAIICEYLGKILEESRDEPPYHILDELNSKVSVADVGRRNIAR